jgi:nicotinamide-nucleotide amidase
MADIRTKLEPVVQEVRHRLGNFILAEDEQTLEGVVLTQLTARQATLAVVETFTGGQIAARLAPLPGAEAVFRRGTVARSLAEVATAVGLAAPPAGELTPEVAATVARAARQQTGATHALAVLVDMEEGTDRIDLSGTICIAIATAGDVASRHSRLAGGRDWVRLGAVEMGLDCLRRYVQGLPLYERTDFEKTDEKA